MVCRALSQNFNIPLLTRESKRSHFNWDNELALSGNRRLDEMGCWFLLQPQYSIASNRRCFISYSLALVQAVLWLEGPMETQDWQEGRSSLTHMEDGVPMEAVLSQEKTQQRWTDLEPTLFDKLPNPLSLVALPNAPSSRYKTLPHDIGFLLLSSKGSFDLNGARQIGIAWFSIGK